MSGVKLKASVGLAALSLTCLGYAIDLSAIGLAMCLIVPRAMGRTMGLKNPQGVGLTVAVLLYLFVVYQTIDVVNPVDLFAIGLPLNLVDPLTIGLPVNMLTVG